jgi:RNA polymerase sigma-70 factor, ECF subfamily
VTPLQTASQAFIAQRVELLAYICYLVGDRHGAEDIFQEVWISLAAELEKQVVISNVRGWCRQVAKNKVIDYLRRQRRSDVPLGDSIILLVDHISSLSDEFPNHQVALEDQQRALRRCLSKLPEKSRQILVLRYQQGMSLQDLSHGLRMNLEAVSKWLYRLRKSVGECVRIQLRQEQPS